MSWVKAKFSKPTPWTTFSGVTLLGYGLSPSAVEPSEVESTGRSHSSGRSRVTVRAAVSIAVSRNICCRMWRLSIWLRSETPCCS